ncbi:peptide ABC transporter [Agrobacterium larrymoorei]|uniref:ABC transporter substrate-binding protein n=1 Tax=Agrobacterium larrymoorei TaxID=160699 RepID=UPI001573C75E|nr:ABC transporter substrate-binding protein [Agrobacterium larrymoorei]NTJ43686.1 peptide ABC transporter [Agrobacterium larrymoorei]
MKNVRNGLLAVAAGWLLSTATPQFAMAKDMFTVNLVNEPSSLDPHLQWNPDSYFVYRNIFDNIVTRDDDGKIVPQLATEWTYLSDTKIEFTIRDDVTFHNGQKLTPEDVAFSVKRIIDPAFASPQLSQFNKIVNAEVTGPSKVTLTTDGAYPALLAQLVKLSVLPKETVEKVGKDAFNLNPIGSGPYKFKRWDRGVAVVVEANADYWGDKGRFKEVTFRAVPDAATRLANIQAGAADLVVTLDSDLAAQLEGSTSGKALSVLTERVAYFAFNAQKAPMDNANLRKAVAYAIDKEGITQGILGGYDKPVDQFMSPAHFGWVEGIAATPYDPEKAKELIAAAGSAATQPIPLLTSPVYDQRVVQALQQMLTDVGLNAQIQMTDMATWLKQMQGGPATVPATAFSRWSCACQDADGILFPTLNSTSGWATAGDKSIDDALVAARQTLDEAKRLELYKTVQQINSDKNYLIPLYQAAIIYGASNKLQWKPTPNESMFLNRMTWTD